MVVALRCPLHVGHQNAHMQGPLSPLETAGSYLQAMFFPIHNLRNTEPIAPSVSHLPQIFGCPAVYISGPEDQSSRTHTGTHCEHRKLVWKAKKRTRQPRLPVNSSCFRLESEPRYFGRALALIYPPHVQRGLGPVCRKTLTTKYLYPTRYLP